MGADTTLWPALLAGGFALGGTAIGLAVTLFRDSAQERRDKKKRRADKFEEMVAAVYDFDHWLNGIRQRDVLGESERVGPETVSPFAKVQSISAVYFPQFNTLVRELEIGADQYRIWINEAVKKGNSTDISRIKEGFPKVYVEKREALLSALKEFARKNFQ